MARLCAFHQYLREMGYVFFNVIGVTIHSFQRVNYKSMISNNEYCRGDFYPLRPRAHVASSIKASFLYMKQQVKVEFCHCRKITSERRRSSFGVVRGNEALE